MVCSSSPSSGRMTVAFSLSSFVSTQEESPFKSRMQGNVSGEISSSFGRHITLPFSPALSAARRQAPALIFSEPESPASKNCGETCLPFRRRRTERLRKRAGMKSTSEGESGAIAAAVETDVGDSLMMHLFRLPSRACPKLFLIRAGKGCQWTAAHGRQKVRSPSA